ncbi:Dimer-Tnp-hAT domain containing protein [Pyrenophora tritici-repentis]|nr:Dimer-Tnp-hAT domain containing protein [Pyrenophora tritici-repentis]
MDEAIDALINPSSSDEASAAEDEYTRWKRSEPAAERGTEYANNPIKYWVAVRDRYPSLSKLALDVLSIPASSSWPFCPIDSVATPAYFDISTLTIPLTACELLTFFPCHIWISELQNRFSRNQIKGTFQAIFIDYQRDLTIPHVITPQQVRSLIKTAARACPPNSKSCSTYTVYKYRFTLSPRIPEKCGVEIKIPYTLIHCADGVNPAKFPKGSDAGPFTRALIHARTRNQDIMLNELDGYIARWGISRELDRLYSDPSLTDRYANEVKEYARGLRDTAKAKGYKWDC